MPIRREIPQKKRRSALRGGAVAGGLIGLAVVLAFAAAWWRWYSPVARFRYAMAPVADGAEAAMIDRVGAAMTDRAEDAMTDRAGAAMTDRTAIAMHHLTTAHLYQTLSR